MRGLWGTPETARLPPDSSCTKRCRDEALGLPNHDAVVSFLGSGILAIRTVLNREFAVSGISQLLEMAILKGGCSTHTPEPK
jgi:hypothetical protein